MSLVTQDLKYLSTESHMKDRGLSREGPSVKAEIIMWTIICWVYLMI